MTHLHSIIIGMMIFGFVCVVLFISEIDKRVDRIIAMYQQQLRRRRVNQPVKRKRSTVVPPIRQAE